MVASSGPVRWLMQVSFFFHSYEALMVNEFHGYMHLVFNPAGTQMGKNVRGLNCEPEGGARAHSTLAVDLTARPRGCRR